MDKITESIAHFIGLFQTSVEQARAHKDFSEFQALKAAQHDDPELTSVKVEVRAPHDFEDMTPGVRYDAPPPQLIWEVPWAKVDFTPPTVEVPFDRAAPALGDQNSGWIPAVATGSQVLHEIQPSGSLVDIINQTIRLDDNDYVSVGGHGLTFTPIEGQGADLASLTDMAAPFSPLDHGMPGSATEMTDFVITAATSLKSLVAQEAADPTEGVFVAGSTHLEGTFVNGVTTDEAPKLEDHLPNAKPAAAVDDAPVQSVGQTSVSVDMSVEVNAGGNTLMNTAYINNSWLASTVMAAVGNHIEVNAIVQVNVWSDVDAVGSSLSGWQMDPDHPTEGFNIAAFTHIDPLADQAGDAPAPGDFPSGWAVTVIDGDLINMNWVQQYSFVSDNDIHVLSSSGVKTVVTTGENDVGNNVSLHDLGLYYDLIVVGGNIYDGNFIQQMNVLLDDDLAGGVAGFHTTGDANLSTSNNLLWNEASITDVGSNQFDSLPDAYRTMAENFANGNRDVPLDVLTDPAFASLAGLRVLYITGDYIDLQYINQVNVLGDSDQVALAMNTVTQAYPDANWDVSTGSNALVNAAQIIDVDTMGKTYVGGDHYSDEILIQAEFISDAPQFGSQNPDQLVNEAVAFLADDDTHTIASDDPSHMHTTHDAVPTDPMQTVVS